MILTQQHDIALVLLDVVMETEDAGLRLIHSLREVIGNRDARVVLLTGEPGLAPAHEVMRDYDINDYWAKSELCAERLLTVLTAAVRGYAQLRAVATARRGLQMIVESSNALFCSKNTRELSAKILTEISSLLNLQAEGVVCLRLNEGQNEAELAVRIVGANGRFSGAVEGNLDRLDAPQVAKALSQCLLV